MLRHLVVAVLAVALAGPAASNCLTAGTVQNKFIVTYSIVPDPFHMFSFYTMPRTTAEAKKDHFAEVGSNRWQEKTTVWCRDNDYRVCVIFDNNGIVAGIQVSVRVSELKNVPLQEPSTIPEWSRQTFLNQDVYSATTFFVHKDVLSSGGRSELAKNDLTAPTGLYILQTDDNGVETGRLHVTVDEADAESVGFREQACFFGMGKHYFQELTKESTCEAQRPYFLLYGPKTKKLNGIGFTMYGKASQGRGWFENPPALAAKAIAPKSPDCMSKWINQYGLFTMHVFFVDRPWLTWC